MVKRTRRNRGNRVTQRPQSANQPVNDSSPSDLGANQGHHDRSPEWGDSLQGSSPSFGVTTNDNQSSGHPSSGHPSSGHPSSGHPLPTTGDLSANVAVEGKSLCVSPQTSFGDLVYSDSSEAPSSENDTGDEALGAPRAHPSKPTRHNYCDALPSHADPQVGAQPKSPDRSVDPPTQVRVGADTAHWSMLGEDTTILSSSHTGSARRRPRQRSKSPQDTGTDQRPPVGALVNLAKPSQPPLRQPTPRQHASHPPEVASQERVRSRDVDQYPPVIFPLHSGISPITSSSYTAERTSEAHNDYATPFYHRPEHNLTGWTPPRTERHHRPVTCGAIPISQYHFEGGEIDDGKLTCKPMVGSGRQHGHQNNGRPQGSGFAFWGLRGIVSSTEHWIDSWVSWISSILSCSAESFKQTGFTTGKFVVRWMLPSCAMLSLSLLAASYISLFSYGVVYWLAVPPRVRTFPLFFDYGYGARELDEIGGELRDGAHQFDRNTERISVKTQHGDDVAKVETPSGAECERRNLFTESGKFSCGSEENVAPGKTEHHRGDIRSIPSNNGLRNCGGGSMWNPLNGYQSAVTFVDFDNRTWDVLPSQHKQSESDGGHVPLKRRKCERGDHYCLLFERQSLGHRLVTGYELNFVVEFTYTHPHHFVQTSHPLVKNSVATPVMFALDLFDWNSTRIARSKRPFIPKTMSTIADVARTICLIFPMALGFFEPHQTVRLPLIERFPHSERHALALAKLEMNPYLVVQSASLLIETQLWGWRWYLREYPVITGFIFCSLTLMSLLTCMFIPCFYLYFKLLRSDQLPS